MQQAFFIIISVAGAIYALFVKETKVAFGLFIVGLSFVFAIPDLVTGVWEDVFGAMAMIIFALGILVMVFKKKTQPEKEEKKDEEEKVQNTQ